VADLKDQIRGKEGDLVELRGGGGASAGGSLDASLCYAFGDGIWKALVSLPCQIKVKLCDGLGESYNPPPSSSSGSAIDMRAQVRLAGGEWTDCESSFQGSEGLVQFVAGYDVEHEVAITVGGQGGKHICGSPFLIPAMRPMPKAVAPQDEAELGVDEASASLWSLRRYMRPSEASDPPKYDHVSSEMVPLPATALAGGGGKLAFVGTLPEGACVLEVAARGYYTTLDWVYVETSAVKALEPLAVTMEAPNPDGNQVEESDEDSEVSL